MRYLLSRQTLLPLVKLLRMQSSVPTQKHSFESDPDGEVRSFKDIPGPKGLPFVGAIHRYMMGGGFSKMHKLTMEMFAEFGPIFKQTILGATFLHILDPVDIEKVFRSAGKYPERYGFTSLLDYNKERNENFFNLIVLQGKEWHRIRQALSPKMLRPREVYENIDNFNIIVDDALKSFRQARGSRSNEGEIPYLKDELSKWSTESVGNLVFDARVGLYEDPPNEDAQRFIKAIEGLFECTHNLDVGLEGLFNKVFRPPSWKRLCHSIDFILEFGQKMVDAKIKRLDEELNDPEKLLNEKGVPLLTYLLAKQHLTPEEIASATVEMFTAGVDTTSTTLHWALYNLARFPEVQERLHKEIVTVVSEDGNLTAKDMGKIPYTKAFLKESMRISPVIPDNTRILNKDLVLSGYHIPAGTIVLPSIFASCRTHFKDPEQFRPERWLRETADQSHAFSFLPFGYGTRMCIGKRTAELEIYLFLSKVVQQFKLEYNDQVLETVESTLKLVLTPDKHLKINFIDR